MDLLPFVSRCASCGEPVSFPTERGVNDCICGQVLRRKADGSTKPAKWTRAQAHSAEQRGDHDRARRIWEALRQGERQSAATENEDRRILAAAERNLDRVAARNREAIITPAVSKMGRGSRS